MTKSTVGISQRIWARAGNEITRYLTVACAALALGYASITGVQAQDEKYNIALIPGTTTDAFYITKHRGAEAAAAALGVELLYQGPAFDAPASIVDNIKTGLVDIAIAQHPAEIGYFGVVAAYAQDMPNPKLHRKSCLVTAAILHPL